MGTASITFFDGPAPIEKLHERMQQIVKANPWLMGTILARNGQSLLEFETDPEKIYYPVPDVGPEKIRIHRGMTCNEISDTVYPLLTPGFANGPDRKGLFKVSVVRDAFEPESRFALIVSISHNLGDGHTFYAIHNMIGFDQPIVAYNAARVDETAYIQALEQKMGTKETAHLFEKILIKDQIATAAATVHGWRPSLPLVPSWAANNFVTREIDTACVSRKQARLQGLTGEFVSMNDLISYELMTAADRDTTIMSINMRNRIELPEELGGSPGDEHMGNYIQVLSYR